LAGAGKNGQAQIVDGKIIVVNPRDGGNYATLYPPEEGVLILINGEEIKAPVEVKEEDIIEVIALKLEEEPKMEFRISPDGLMAEIAVYPRIINEFYLKDMEMKTSLKPVVEKKEHRENVLTLLDAEMALKNHNIVYGLDEVALKEAVEKAEGEFKKIAMGKEAQEGRDSRIEFLINPEAEKIVYGEEEHHVDFRERFRFPEVKKGDVIARIHPPVEGVPGKKVTGEIILPRPVKSTRIRYGEGIEAVENEAVIVAQKDGRLVVNGNHLKVVHLLVHNADVDLESGNIRFYGDIYIYGNIKEGMTVEAQGDLFVEGSCYEAAVKAGGEIRFTRNIIKSRIEGGLYFALLKKLIPALNKLEEQLGGAIRNIKEVEKGLWGRDQEIADRTLGFITRSVIEKTTHSVKDSISTLEQLLSQLEAPGLNPFRELLSPIKLFFTSPPQPDALTELVALRNKLTALSEKYKEQLQEIPVFTASYIQNSDISFGGAINVVGPGSYMSNLKAGEGVTVQGAFRGGSIESQGDVKVKEFVYIASASESITKKPAIRVKVPVHRSIFFGKVRIDTTVQVGKYVHRFSKDAERVKIGYNRESGMLQVTNF